MYIIIIILPLLGSIISGLFGRKLGIIGSNIIVCICLILANFLSIICFYEILICRSSIHLKLFIWIDIELLQINWGFLFDSLSISIISIILIVSIAVHIYSINYINEDPHPQRFMSYLSLFTFSIILLVSADNYLIIFVGQNFPA
jgi:NADH-ubiquinone oxidoreductase chain 5